MAPKKFLRAFLIEFGPITAFFIATDTHNFFIATEVLIVFTLLGLIVSLCLDKRIPFFSVISSCFVLLFGTMTVFLEDPYWLVFEYTLYNGMFAAVLLVGHYRNISVLKLLFIGMFNITDRGWKILSLRWCVMFFLTAVGNEIVWHYFSVEVWLHYRLWAAVMLCLFGLSQFFLARSERMPDATEWGLRQ